MESVPRYSLTKQRRSIKGNRSWQLAVKREPYCVAATSHIEDYIADLQPVNPSHVLVI